jgi:hypothetical protein
MVQQKSPITFTTLMDEYNNPSFVTIVANEGLLYSFIVTCATGCTHP